jgi:predicted PurR-regulated permease PerM
MTPRSSESTTRARWRWESAFKDADFVRRVLIVVALGALTLLVWRLADVLLLAFGAVVVAVILRALADLIAHYVPPTRRWSLTIAVFLILAVVAVGVLLFGPQMRAQITQLGTVLPPAAEYVLGEFGLSLRQVTEQLPRMVGSSFSREVMGRVASIGLTVLGALGDLLLVIVAGIFLASDPGLYKRGLVKLFPQSQHERVEGALDASGTALGLWLKGQVVAMAIVGALTAAALWLIGLPSPLALGLIAALGEFIPFVGPILAALPALVIAASQSLEMVLWTLAALVLIQQIESNMVFPLIAKSTVELPPALGLFSVLVFATLFGPLGLVLAVPLTVVVFVLVKKLYVRETLGEETPVPGEAEAGQAGRADQAEAPADNATPQRRPGRRVAATKKAGP